MKAYRVTIKNNFDVTCYVMAESQSGAKTAARSCDESDGLRESDWTDLQAKRIPQFDAGITEEALVASGRMWIDCNCGQQVKSDWGEDCEPGEPGCDELGSRYREPVYLGGKAFCSQACADRHGSKGNEVVMNGICLYAE